MKIKNMLKIIGFLVPAFIFACVTTACSGGSNNDEHEGPAPRFILSGTEAGSGTNFIYYSMNGGTEYAIALTEDGKDLETISSDDMNNARPNEEIPITGIWRYGFANSQATSITIPDTVEVIDFEAFMNSKITSVTIPASVNQIGEAAFYSCKAITKVKFNNTTTSTASSSACMCGDSGQGGGGGTPSGLTLIPSFCFFNCNNLKELVLPESIEEIGYEAFNGCRQLYSTIAFANIKTIRSRAFQGCAALKKVYISDTFFEREEDENGDQTGDPIGIIEDKAFDGCNNALKFYLVGDEKDVQDWLDLHDDNKWRWKNETLNPEATSSAQDTSSTIYVNCYEYEITASGASYTNDWIYTTSNENEVTITSYIGPTEIEVEVDEETEIQQVKLITFPNELPSGSGHNVTRINIDALDSVKANLERVYFPTTLKRIESRMFDNYPNLVVVDDNTASKCSDDDDSVALDKRIILSGLTSLEVIGNSAFVNMGKLAEITKLYLPYSLKAVGNNAFGFADSKNGKHMQAVTDFRWEYNDELSALEVIGGGAFYGLGRSDTSKLVTGGTNHHQERYTGLTENYKLTSLVFPKTFNHFGITTNDKNKYDLDKEETDDAYFGTNAFAGCPLLREVVFKGSARNYVTSTPNTKDNSTCNLFIPSQTFVLNENLRSVVFEERCGWNILFHSAGKKYQPAIGWSSGYAENDFGGNPGIQTIVLPNRYTTIRMQQYAMQGNSRGVVYLSGDLNSKIRGCKGGEKSYRAMVLNNNNLNDDSISNDSKWNLIGDEEFHSNINTYPGYCFASKKTDASTDTKNRFGMNQSMPIYTNVLYDYDHNDVNDDKLNVNVDVFVGFGETNNTNEFVVSDKCAFVTYVDNTNNYATLTKYLYDRYDGEFDGIAVVPPTVTKSDGNTICTVKIIGASAFSAAYCDNKTNNYVNDNIHKDLTAVKIPDTIERIEEYAFLRAYGVKKLSSYTYNSETGNKTDNGDYVMPSSLEYIGKLAFSFCNIKEFLKIPDACVFYENENDTTIEASVFSNNYSLRKITFGNTGTTSSTNYTTTTYAHGLDTYTSAIYSTVSVSKNKSSLLLVLNRDSSDYLATSGVNNTEVSNVNNQSVLNGQYANNYLYGAFKMCRWVDVLTLGTPKDKTIDQPLISGIYTINNGQIEDNLIYLNTEKDFTSNKNNCMLKSIIIVASNNEIITPPYSFEGCGQLKSVRLPRIENGVLPAGLFAFASNEDLAFEVPDSISGTTFMPCDKGVLNLTYTAYSKISAEAFKGTNINTLIAPKPWAENPDDPETNNNPNYFTIEQDAFRGCTKLSLIDFSNVTGRVIINGSFRGTGTTGDTTNIPNGLFDFGTTAKIEFGAEAFKGATFTGDSNDVNAKKTFTFPAKTAFIGTSCFEDCTTLQKVDTVDDAEILELEPVAADITGTGAQMNNSDFDDLKERGLVSSADGFKQIGDYAFFHCINLQDFALNKFTNLERIGNYAFSMAVLSGTAVSVSDNNNTVMNNGNNQAYICTNGIIDLPASITNLGVGAFYGSNITSVTINSVSIRFERGTSRHTSDTRASANRGGHTFRHCHNLTEVFFSNPDCEWRMLYITIDDKNGRGQDNYFSNNKSLQKVYLPTDYDILYSGYTSDSIRPDSMVWDSTVSDSLKFYLYHTTKEHNPNGQALSVYWRRVANNNNKQVVYYVGDVTDMRKEVDGKYSLYIADAQYWTMKNGSPLYLGTATVNATTGAVTFSTGETLNSLTYSINGESPVSISYDALNSTTRASGNVSLAANDVVTVSLNGNALKYGNTGNDTSFTATSAGNYALVINGSDRFFITDTTLVVIQENSSTITEREVTLTQEVSFTLVAVSTPAGATDEKIWTSSVPGVATVSNGVVTPVSAGTTRITVTMGASSAYVDVTVHDYCVVTVGSTPTHVSSYDASNNPHAEYNITLAANDEVSVTLNGDSLYYGESGDDTSFTATTAGNYVLVIDNNDRFYITCAATNISISEGDSHTLYLNTDLSYQLTTTITPTNATDTLVWSSGDENVATVSENGLITPVSEGTVTIMIRAGETTDAIEITVLETVCTLTYGENEVELNYNAANSPRAEQTITLAVDDEVSVVLNGNSLYYGVSGSETTFTATVAGTYTFVINGNNRFLMSAPATAVAIQKAGETINSFEINATQNQQLTALISPANCTETESLSWSSGNNSVATVTAGGLVHGVGPGTTTITATVGNVNTSVTVTVNDYCVLTVGGNSTVINYDGSQGSVRAQENVILIADDQVSITLNGTPLKYGASGDATSFTAVDGGTYIITVDGNDRFTYELHATGVVIQENSSTISSREMYLTQGTATFVAVPTPGTTTDSVTSWTSSVPGVATVSNGVVTPVSAGTTRITVNYGSVSAYVDVAVKDCYQVSYGSEDSIIITETGVSGTYSAQISPDKDDVLNISLNGTPINVANISIANNSNLYKDAGNSNAITVLWGYEDNLILTDLGEGDYSVSFALPTAHTGKVGGNTIALTTDTPTGTDKAKYSVSLNSGDVLTLYYGKDALTCTDTSSTTYTAPYTGTHYINVDSSDNYYVTILTTGLTISEGDSQTLYLGVDLTKQLHAVLTPNCSTQETTWESSNTAVATVDQNGVVTPLTAGQTTITATSGSQSDTITINVEHCYSVSINDGDPIRLELNDDNKPEGVVHQYVASLSTDTDDVISFKYDGNDISVTPESGYNLYIDSGDIKVVVGTDDSLFFKDLGNDTYSAFYADYNLKVGGSVHAFERTSPDYGNKAQFTIALVRDDVLTVNYGRSALTFNTNSSTSYTSLRPGTYTIYVSSSDNQVYLGIPNKVASNIRATVNGQPITLQDETPNVGDVAKYTVNLTEGDVIAFNEGYDTLVFPNLNGASSFKALSTQSYTFFVNGNFEVYVAPEYINIYFTNNYSWSSVYVHAWKNGSNPEQNNGGWPGEEMTYSYTNDMSQDVYVIMLDKSAYDRIIFNNNGGSQTETIVLSNSIISGDGYYISGGSNSSLTVGTWHNDND